MKERSRSYRRGLHAERWAGIYLRLRGYRILERRCKTPLGEIDLIVRKGRVLAMVEVKSRLTHAEAIESVRPAARRRIENAARWYLSRHPEFADFDVRFDLMVFSGGRFGIPRALHLDNAWRPAS
ncbi:MAG: YraN family protein [Alphaproteobacteria bacterium]|nr:YraN family protein [Alphaproteobacteria bacterium]